MSLKARILLPIAVLMLFAYFSAYFVGKNRADFWIEDNEVSNMDTHSQIVAELWDSMGGCNEDQKPELISMNEDNFYTTLISVEIRCKDSDFVARSVGFPEFSKELSDEEFYERVKDVDDVEWLIFNREGRDANIVLARVYIESRTISEFLWTSEFFILLGILLLSAIALYYLIGGLLRPLRSLRKAADGPNLDFQTLKTPEELVPLKNLILGFKDRESSADQLKSSQLDKERYFTANAAHELLTPLSAIKTEVQLQQRLVDDDEMKSWLGDLLTRVNRATHTVDQLMTLARLDPDSTPGEKSPVDIGMLMTEITEDYTDRLSSKFVTITQVFSGNNSVFAYPGLIETLLRNLISNAVKYTPVEGKIEMRTKADNGWLHITVSNSCDRLPAYLVDQMFDRFVRGPHEVETGSGLGLAISQRIALLHETDLSPVIAPEKDNLSFSLSLPLA